MHPIFFPSAHNRLWFQYIYMKRKSAYSSHNSFWYTYIGANITPVVLFSCQNSFNTFLHRFVYFCFHFQIKYLQKWKSFFFLFSLHSKKENWVICHIFVYSVVSMCLCGWKKNETRKNGCGWIFTLFSRFDGMRFGSVNISRDKTNSLRHFFFLLLFDTIWNMHRTNIIDICIYWHETLWRTQSYQSIIDTHATLKEKKRFCIVKKHWSFFEICINHCIKIEANLLTNFWNIPKKKLFWIEFFYNKHFPSLSWTIVTILNVKINHKNINWCIFISHKFKKNEILKIPIFHAFSMNNFSKTVLSRGAN